MGWASDTMAGITRSQWSDYMSRYIPIENELMTYYDNPTKTAEAIGAARGLSGQASDAAEANTRIELARYGQQDKLNDPAFARGLSLNRAAAGVDAANSTRQHMADRGNLLLTGGLTSKGL